MNPKTRDRIRKAAIEAISENDDVSAFELVALLSPPKPDKEKEEEVFTLPFSPLDYDEMELSHRRVWACRVAAGWRFDSLYGYWLAPCDTPECNWVEEGYPLPEDAEFPAWAAAFYHYELEDSK